MINKKFDDFEIRHRLGKGAVGEVYLAEQVSLERNVAIKFLFNADTATGEAVYSRFLNEAKLMAAIRHPNIVDVLRVGEFDHKPYIVMEYVNGEPIDQYFSNRPFSITKEFAIWKAVISIAQGLECALNNGIVHRDIKPENILVGSDKQPKICDFGISKKIGEDSSITNQGVIVGSPHYISPEQVLGESVGYHTDMYSLGATIYKLFTNQVMFQEDTTIDILFKQRSAKPASPHELEPGISKSSMFILGKMLHKKKEKRYLAYQDLISDILALLGEEPLGYANSNDALEVFDFMNDDFSSLEKGAFLKKMPFKKEKKEKKKKKKLLFVSGDKLHKPCVKICSQFDIHYAATLEEIKYILQTDKFILIFSLDFIGVRLIDFLSEIRSYKPSTSFLFFSNDPAPPSLRDYFVKEDCKSFFSKLDGPLPRVGDISVANAIKLIEIFRWSLRLGIHFVDDEELSGCLSFSKGEEIDTLPSQEAYLFSIWQGGVSELSSGKLKKCSCLNEMKGQYQEKRKRLAVEKKVGAMFGNEKNGNDKSQKSTTSLLLDSDSGKNVKHPKKKILIKHFNILIAIILILLLVAVAIYLIVNL